MNRSYQVTVDNPNGSGKVVLLGTQHNSERSSEDIEEYFEKHTPDRICIEKSRRAHETDGKLESLKYVLDLFRAYPLAIVSLVFRQLSQVETDSEISRVCSLAEDNEIPIHPVDKNLITVFKELKQADGTGSSNSTPTTFLAEYGTQPEQVMDTPFEYSPQAVYEADKLNSDPVQYRYLSEGRNEQMSKEVQKLLEKYPDDHIFFPVGYSHVYGIQKRLQEEGNSGGNSAALSEDGNKGVP